MDHVVLCGDSVFDNQSYVRAGEPDVVKQLQQLLPTASRATLLARDGDTTAEVRLQLEHLPADATHLFLSVGGNDALGHFELLSEKANSLGVALTRLAEVADAFERKFDAVLASFLGCDLPTAICTIYYPRFDSEDPSRLSGLGISLIDPAKRKALQRQAVTALTIFNDVIIRKAFESGLALLDLRLICNEDKDYANPIEPSSTGGAKIAAAIAEVLLSHDFSRRRTEIFV